MKKSTQAQLAPFAVLAEKVVMTYVQAVLVVLVAADVFDASKLQAFAIAGIPAALTVLANGLPVIPVGLPFWVDLVLRTVRTYATSFIGFLLAMPVFHLNFTAAVAANTAAIPAVLAVLKGGVASRFGRSDSAALLPKSLDVPAAAAA